MLGINILLILVFSFFLLQNTWDKPLLLPKTISIQEDLIDSIKQTSNIVVQIITEDKTTYYQEDSNEDTLIDKQSIQKKWNGIILSKRWYILTNSHVVDNTNLVYTVITADNKNFIVKKIRKDELLDLAILFIETSDFLSEAKFIDIDTVVDVGTFVFSIGNPLSEYPNTVSFWIISAKGRNLLATPSNSVYYAGFYQTDAALNPWNSWWPLISLSGEVLGLVTAISRWGNNIGFALPLNETFVSTTLSLIEENNTLLRPYLGISYTDTESGAKIDTIFAGSPVQGTLLVGDNILALDKRKLSSITPLLYYLYTYKPNDTVIFTVSRNNQILTIPIVLGQKTL